MNCKHCKIDFDGLSNSQKANHTRWCKQNPDRNKWNKHEQGKQAWGAYKDFEVCCKSCNKTFFVNEREKLYPQKEQYFCSRSCANSIGGKAKAEKYHYDEVAHYTTVAWRYHEKKCMICDECNIVAVHHLNENHEDNRPDNLVPLCPTHHQYWHSRYRYLIEEKVHDYMNKFKGEWDCSGWSPHLQ